MINLNKFKEVFEEANKRGFENEDIPVLVDIIQMLTECLDEVQNGNRDPAFNSELDA